MDSRKRTYDNRRGGFQQRGDDRGPNGGDRDRYNRSNQSRSPSFDTGVERKRGNFNRDGGPGSDYNTKSRNSGDPKLVGFRPGSFLEILGIDLDRLLTVEKREKQNKKRKRSVESSSNGGNGNGRGHHKRTSEDDPGFSGSSQKRSLTADGFRPGAFKEIGLEVAEKGFGGKRSCQEEKEGGFLDDLDEMDPYAESLRPSKHSRNSLVPPPRPPPLPSAGSSGPVRIVRNMTDVSSVRSRLGNRNGNEEGQKTGQNDFCAKKFPSKSEDTLKNNGSRLASKDLSSFESGIKALAAVKRRSDVERVSSNKEAPSVDSKSLKDQNGPRSGSSGGVPSAQSGATINLNHRPTLSTVCKAPVSVGNRPKSADNLDSKVGDEVIVPKMAADDVTGPKNSGGCGILHKSASENLIKNASVDESNAKIDKIEENRQNFQLKIDSPKNKVEKNEESESEEGEISDSD